MSWDKNTFVSFSSRPALPSTCIGTFSFSLGLPVTDFFVSVVSSGSTSDVLEAFLLLSFVIRLCSRPAALALGIRRCRVRSSPLPLRISLTPLRRDIVSHFLILKKACSNRLGDALFALASAALALSHACICTESSAFPFTLLNGSSKLLFFVGCVATIHCGPSSF